jgi:hypothetical protein
MPKNYLYNGGQGVPCGQLHWWRLQQPRPASGPWEFGAGQVPCYDSRSVSLEPAVQSSTNMLQKGALKIYLMPRNLGRPHTLPRGARALAGAELPPIEQWNRGRGEGTNRMRCRGEGTNRMRCRSVSFAHGNALCIAKDLGALSKPALEHFVVIYLAVNFQQMNSSGASQGFVAGRTSSTCMRSALSAKSLPLFRGAGQPLSVLVPTGGGDSEYCSLAYSASVHSAELK